MCGSVPAVLVHDIVKGLSTDKLLQDGQELLHGLEFCAASSRTLMAAIVIMVNHRTLASGCLRSVELIVAPYVAVWSHE